MKKRRREEREGKERKRKGRGGDFLEAEEEMRMQGGRQVDLRRVS